MLYLVPTPIGNLEDITLRALRVLREATLVLAEDTRTTGNLFRHHGITTRLAPHHQFNEHRSVQGIIEKLLSGETIALVSDAGTPGISDAGFLLVRECLKNNIRVECLPGATALIPALVGSGIPCDRFIFEGFLPHKKGRQTRLRQLAEEERTIVLYESPHRLVKCLGQLSTFFGPGRHACVAREITKLHEEYRRGTLEELAFHYSETSVRGEIVVVVEGKKKGDQEPEEDLSISNEE